MLLAKVLEQFTYPGESPATPYVEQDKSSPRHMDCCEDWAEQSPPQRLRLTGKHLKDSSGGARGKEPAWNAGDAGSVPNLGRAPGGGNRNPLEYSCLENPIDRGAWRAPVPGVAESDRTQQQQSPYQVGITVSTVLLIKKKHTGGILPLNSRYWAESLGVLKSASQISNGQDIKSSSLQDTNQELL